MNLENRKDLTKLEFLSGDLQTTDLFTDHYEGLLRTPQSQDMLKAMKELLLRQAQFLMNSWLEDRPSENRERPGNDNIQ